MDGQTPQFTTDLPSNSGGCSVVATKREVIQDQLLTELNDKWKVAILATKEDLDLFIEAMQCLNSSESDRLLADMRQLRKVAFERGKQ